MLKKTLNRETMMARARKKALPFEALSKGRQRTRIIKDAISQIELGILTPDSGTYMKMYETYGLKDLRKIMLKGIEKKEEVCECCAKGALFAACVFNVNKVKINQDISEETFQKKKLTPWFTSLELDMMEAAFERRIVTDDTNTLCEDENEDRPTELGQRCIDFFKQDEYLSNDKARLLAILRNTLQNKTFKP